jgi:hypothetical protein
LSFLFKSKNKLSLGSRTIEQKTFFLHIISQIFNGISIGILLLQDVILKKSLGGSDFEIMILSFFLCTAFLVSIFGTEIVNRSFKPSKTLLLMGFIGKIFLILLPLFDNTIYYIACISLTAYFDSMLLSTWNIVFKHNYSDKNRSKYFSYVTTISVIITLITLTLFGYLMDRNNNLYKYSFPLAGIFGMFTYYNLSRMIKMSLVNFPREVFKTQKRQSIRLIKDILSLPLLLIKKIFKENKPFFRFEANFFLYGMAFMVISPAIPVYLVDGLHLSYTPISFAKGLVFHSALIIFTPMMGKYHGSGNPTKFCAYIFMILAFYPFLLMAANYTSWFHWKYDLTYIVYIAHFIFGLGMSGISISWALSSIYYAPKFEESNYQAVHITLTGIRGIFSPFLGYLVMKIFSIEYTFMLSIILFITGGFLMFRENKKQELENRLKTVTCE